jgi:hypothetical protein
MQTDLNPDLVAPALWPLPVQLIAVAVGLALIVIAWRRRESR